MLKSWGWTERSKHQASETNKTKEEASPKGTGVSSPPVQPTPDLQLAQPYSPPNLKGKPSR